MQDYVDRKLTNTKLPFIPKKFPYGPYQVQYYKDDPMKIRCPQSTTQLAFLHDVLENECDSVILATEPNKDGELLARDILRFLKCDKPIYRV